MVAPSLCGARIDIDLRDHSTDMEREHASNLVDFVAVAERGSSVIYHACKFWIGEMHV
jgi:hypothetical protein